jgi:hypothetical protein
MPVAREILTMSAGVMHTPKFVQQAPHLAHPIWLLLADGYNKRMGRGKIGKGK